MAFVLAKILKIYLVKVKIVFLNCNEMNLLFYIEIATLKLSKPNPRSFKYPEYRPSVEFQRFSKI